MSRLRARLGSVDVPVLDLGPKEVEKIVEELLLLESLLSSSKLTKKDVENIVKEVEASALKRLRLS